MPKLDVVISATESAGQMQGDLQLPKLEVIDPVKQASSANFTESKRRKENHEFDNYMGLRPVPLPAQRCRVGGGTQADDLDLDDIFDEILGECGPTPSSIEGIGSVPEQSQPSCSGTQPLTTPAVAGYTLGKVTPSADPNGFCADHSNVNPSKVGHKVDQLYLF